jgi:ABC-type multidrug transport system ATPase subunit
VEILKGLDLQVHAGEIVGIAGIDGNGQTELVEILTGLRKGTSGDATVNGVSIFNQTPAFGFEHGVSSIPADRQKHGLVLEFSIEDNLILQNYEKEPFAKNKILQRPAIFKHASDSIKNYDIRPGNSEKRPAGTLSGGNQQKVIIAREVQNNKDLLIAVNPTRGLDVGAIEYVHKYIVEQRNKGKAVLLVSFELDEIMSLSRLEAGAVKLNTEEVEVADFVEDCLMPFENIAASKNLDVTLDLGSGTVEADEDLLSHALENILSNAFRHAHSFVVVRYQDQMLTVTNDGKMPAQEDVDHLFDRYHSGSTSEGGTGIGLALTKEIVELHGWQIGARITSEKAMEVWMDLH